MILLPHDANKLNRLLIGILLQLEATGMSQWSIHKYHNNN